MEGLSSYRNKAAAVAAAATLLLTACVSEESSLADPSNVRCDGERTEVEFAGNTTVSFGVHGEHDDDRATVEVRRSDQGVSLRVSGDVTGPPQQLGEDGFTIPVDEIDGSELATFGAGGAWVIDVDGDSVAIFGSCDGM